MKNAFNWDIEQPKIYDANGNEISGYKQIVRNDGDGSWPNIVMKKSFTPMTTQEFSNTAEEVAASIGGTGLVYNDWGNTPVITCQMKISEPLSIAGSKITGLLTLGVGFDGGRSFFIGHKNTYLRCSNEFASIVKDFTSRLTKNNMIRVEHIIENIETYKEYEEKLYKDFVEFQKVDIDEKLVQECVARLVKLNDEEKAMSHKEWEKHLSRQKLNKIDEIMASVRTEMAELGDNAWGLFNGVTHYTTHILDSRGSNELSTMFGAKKTMNQAAVDFCREVMNS